jgi:hypothetical protein
MTVQRAQVQKLIDDAIAAESKDLLAALRFCASFSSDNLEDEDPRAADDARFIAELEGSANLAPGAPSDD